MSFVRCQHCGGVVEVEATAKVKVVAVPVTQESRCGLMPSGSKPDHMYAQCCLLRGHVGYHRTETDSMVWE